MHKSQSRTGSQLFAESLTDVFQKIYEENFPERFGGKECSICADCKNSNDFLKATFECMHESNMCRECVGRYIEHEVQDNGKFEIRCPAEGCRKTMTEKDVKIFASKQVFSRYQKLSVVSGLSQMPDFQWCSNPGCESGQIHYEGQTAPIMTCQSCFQKTCVIHSLAIKDHSSNCPQCEKLAQAFESAHKQVHDFATKIIIELGPQTDEDKMLFESLCEPMIREIAYDIVEGGDGLEDYVCREEQMKKSDEETEALILSISKKCPQCKANIEKNGGCDHMTCGCGYEFCWDCLADYASIRNEGNHFHLSTCAHYRVFSFK